MVDLTAGRISVPPKSAFIRSQYLWAAVNDWLEYGRDLSQRKEWCAKGADVEVDIDREGGFERSDMAGHASQAIDDEDNFGLGALWEVEFGDEGEQEGL